MIYNFEFWDSLYSLPVRLLCCFLLRGNDTISLVRGQTEQHLLPEIYDYVLVRVLVARSNQEIKTRNTETPSGEEREIGGKEETTEQRLKPGRLEEKSLKEKNKRTRQESTGCTYQL